MAPAGSQLQALQADEDGDDWQPGARLRLPSWRWIEVLLALSLASCDHVAERSVVSQPVADTAALHPGRRGFPSAAIEAVADVRCERAQRCKDIGPGLEYASRNECVLSTRAEWSEELIRLDCELGVREGVLNACLRELSEAGCGDEEASGACRPLAICDRLPKPPPIPLAHDPAVPG
jgi:hypothetical protein